MDDNFTIFLILAISIAGAVGLIVSTRWMRLNRSEGAGSGTVAGSASISLENEQLRTQVRDLTERLAGIENRTTTEDRLLAGETQQLRRSE